MAIKLRKIIRVIVISLLSLATAFFLFLMINNFQLRKGITVHVIYSHVGALNIGAWVRKSGVKVGSVTKIRVNPADGRSVIVTIAFKPGETPRKGDKFAIVASGIMGDQYIEDFPAPLSSPPVPDGYTYKGEPMLDLSSLTTDGVALIKKIEESLDILTDLLKTNKQAINNTIKNIEATTKSLKEITDEIKQITDTIPELAATIDLTTKRINNLADKIERETTQFMDTNSKNISITVENIKDSSEKLREAIDNLTKEGAILDVINKRNITTQIPKIMTNLSKTSENLMKLTKDLQDAFEGLGK